MKLKKKVGTVELETPEGEDENGEVSEVPKTGDNAYQSVYFHLMRMYL